METQTKAPPNDGTNTVTNTSHSEGTVAKAIESQTAKLPSDLFLWAAFGSMAGSLALQMMGKKEQSNFVGQWAPTLLILGLYNKLVKVAGSD
jgi:broad specificity polyphosphatase/5'/3'-nucleotidase SurE